MGFFPAAAQIHQRALTATPFVQQYIGPARRQRRRSQTAIPFFVSLLANPGVAVPCRWLRHLAGPMMGLR